MSLTRLKSSTSTISSASGCSKRRAAAASAATTAWKRPWLDRPVSSSVTAWRWTCSCRSTFSSERPVWRASEATSSRSASLKGRSRRATTTMPRGSSCGPGIGAARAETVVHGREGGCCARLLFDGCDRLLGAVEVSHARGFQQRAVGGADRDAPAVGLDRVDDRLRADLQQRGAVEVGGERRADALDRLAQAAALLVELAHALLELARHLVELAAELRELVPPLDGDRRREVAAADPLGGRQEALELAVQLTRDRERAGEREQQEEREQGERDPAAARGGGGGGARVGEERDRGLAAAEVGRAEHRDGVVGPAELDRAAVGKVGRRGRGERVRQGARQLGAVAREHDAHVGSRCGTREARRREGGGLDRDRGRRLATSARARRDANGAASDRAPVADVGDRSGALHDADPREAATSRQCEGGSAVVRGRGTRAQRSRERGVARERAGGTGAVLREAAEVGERRGGDGAALGSRLRVLAVGDDARDDDPQRDHRHDDDQHEEQRQPGAEAHPLPTTGEQAIAAGRGGGGLLDAPLDSPRL